MSLNVAMHFATYTRAFLGRSFLEESTYTLLLHALYANA